ncbi:MAG: hypothetical protein ACRYFX_18530 [Janthinobacterium lividum]
MLTAALTYSWPADLEADAPAIVAGPTYTVNYWVVGEMAGRTHELDTDIYLQAFRAALAYENRGCCVELWEKREGEKPKLCYETEDEN